MGDRGIAPWLERTEEEEEEEIELIRRSLGLEAKTITRVAVAVQ